MVIRESSEKKPVLLTRNLTRPPIGQLMKTGFTKFVRNIIDFNAMKSTQVV